MDNSNCGGDAESFELPFGGPLISYAEYSYDSKGGRTGVRRFRVPPFSRLNLEGEGSLPADGTQSGPATLTERWPPAQYDPRIEFILMRSKRRLGVEYRRFIGGKLTLTGFVKEPLPAGDDGDTGESGEYRKFNPVDIPEARLERMARLALERALGDS